MDFYAEAAPALAMDAIADLGEKTSIDGVTHLVVASCTGFVAPGVDQIIAAQLGLDQGVERTLVGFMGCYAAVTAVRVAHHIARSEPEARVLVVMVELSTLHLSFVDECAIAAGIDPLEYRLRLYDKWGDIGWIRCLKELRDKSGWGEKLPNGHGRGLAISDWTHTDNPGEGTTSAAVAKVEVSKNGTLHVRQLDIAFDCGRIIHEDAVRSAFEGAALFGLNMTLNEMLNIKDGQVVEGDFDDYPILRMGETPRTINIHFGGLSDNPRYHEISESGVGPIGPAVCNAIFQATGKRIRSTPLRNQDLSWS